MIGLITISSLQLAQLEVLNIPLQWLMAQTISSGQLHARISSKAFQTCSMVLPRDIQWNYQFLEVLLLFVKMIDLLKLFAVKQSSIYESPSHLCNSLEASLCSLQVHAHDSFCVLWRLKKSGQCWTHKTIAELCMSANTINTYPWIHMIISLRLQKCRDLLP